MDHGILQVFVSPVVIPRFIAVLANLPITFADTILYIQLTFIVRCTNVRFI